MNYVVNYKNWDKKGNRYAVFAKQIDASKAQLFILKCSKKDQFSKQLARGIYENLSDIEGNYNPKIEYIDMNGDSLIYLLNKYCNDNYYMRLNITQEIDNINGVILEKIIKKSFTVSIKKNAYRKQKRENNI